jgi:hypothetical protein
MRTAAVHTALTIGLALIAVWALAPIDAESDALPPAIERVEPDEAASADDARGLDVSGFASVELWPGTAAVHVPTAADTQAEENAEPPDVRLVAIVRDGDAWRVALYDKEDDRLWIGGLGESVGDVEVAAITAGSVELTHGPWTGRIVLENGPRHFEDGR